MQIADRKLEVGLGSYCGLLIVDRGLRLFNPKSEIRIPKSAPRAGMTLVELLVVIVILTTVVAAAIPIMAPSNVDRQLREASRSLNTFITGAQARAIASGRPYGIALKRLSAETRRNAPITPANPDNDNGLCLEVFYAEQQAPYTGYDRNSRVCVSLLRNVGLVSIRFVTRGPVQNDGLPTGWDGDLFPTSMIRPGDVIEIGDTRFELLDHTKSDNQLLFRDAQQYARVSIQFGFYQRLQQNVVQIIGQPINDTGQLLEPEYDNAGFPLGSDRPQNPHTPTVPPRPPYPYWTRPAPYKILRQATITTDEPYQLPEGTAIDLRASGVGNSFFFYPTVPTTTVGSHPRVDNDAPIFIMFTPEGRVSRVTFSISTTTSTGALPNDKFDDSVVDPVFLLVGRRENSPPPPVASDPTLTTTGVPPVGTLNRDEAMSKLKESINWLNGDSRWLVLGAQSGRVVTIENGFVDPSIVINQNLNGPNPFAQSSEPLRNVQIFAAREFAPEMSQLGGR